MKNYYGNECGYHTPKATAKALLDIRIAFEDTSLEFSDASWHNDEADSIVCEDLNFHIYIPNDEYGFDFFTIFDEEQNVIGGENIKGIDAVIETIKTEFATTLKLGEFIEKI